MSYFCQDDNRKYTEIGLFSNPKVFTRNSSIPSGDARYGDCASGITKTAGTVARYRNAQVDPRPSPSPQPASAPRLRLISQVPIGYNGPGGNLTATSAVTNANCSILLSPSILQVSNATLFEPGAGWCNDGDVVTPGAYRLSQVEPAGLRFQKWSCYYSSSQHPAGFVTLYIPVNFTRSMTLTCVANYTLMPAPSPEPR
jgi:hypothetical protein